MDFKIKKWLQRPAQKPSETVSETPQVPDDKSELKALLSSMVEGVIVIDQKERVVLLSDPVYKMLDLRSKDFLGRAYWEVIRNGEINGLLKEVFAKKEPAKKEIAIIFPEERFFTLQVSPVLDNKNNLSNIICVFHDITDLKRLENMRAEFVANVSHELKTPLTSIKGFVETLKSGALEDPKSARKFLDIIDNHTQKLESLIKDILSLSKIESRDVSLNLEKLDLHKTMEEVCTLYKSQAEKKVLQIECLIPAGKFFVRADGEKIEQVFSNLLNNAIKFTPDGGHIKINVTYEDDFAKIDIEDSGVGISEEHLPRIFERFYRVDKSRSRELGGTGLGLAIVKHIVQAHKGHIQVSSKIGIGSTFSVFLPFNSSPQS